MLAYNFYYVYNCSSLIGMGWRTLKDQHHWYRRLIRKRSDQELHYRYSVHSCQLVVTARRRRVWQRKRSILEGKPAWNVNTAYCIQQVIKSLTIFRMQAVPVAGLAHRHIPFAVGVFHTEWCSLGVVGQHLGTYNRPVFGHHT